MDSRINAVTSSSSLAASRMRAMRAFLSASKRARPLAMRRARELGVSGPAIGMMRRVAFPTSQIGTANRRRRRMSESSALVATSTGLGPTATVLTPQNLLTHSCRWPRYNIPSVADDPLINSCCERLQELRLDKSGYESRCLSCLLKQRKPFFVGRTGVSDQRIK